MVDSIKYNIFPNIFLYPGAGLPMIYQFRPHGTDPDRCIFDQMILRPAPKDGPRPAPAEPFRIGGDDSWTIVPGLRSEEHTSELQSLMRNSYAVFCLKKKKKTQTTKHRETVILNSVY